jgi:hypothetical protein
LVDHADLHADMPGQTGLRDAVLLQEPPKEHSGMKG